MAEPVRALPAERTDERLDRDRPSPSRRLLADLARDRSTLAGIVVILAVALAALLAPILPLADPNATNPALRLAPIGQNGFALGSDQLGRDILSRVVWGARVSLFVGFVSAGIALLVGGTLGLISGYLGGVVENAIMRVVDTLMAFPYVLLAILLVAALGPGLVNAMLAVAIANVSFYARGVRSAVLVLRSQEYVEAARAVGASRLHILLREILPNVIPTAVVAASLNVGWMITETAGLSFIGLGAQPPTADWGTMLADGREVITVAYHVGAIPGLAILVLVVGTNLLGEGLRDALDPRFRS